MLTLAHFNRAALRGKSKVTNARFANGHLEFLMTPAGEALDYRFSESRECWVRKSRIRPESCTATRNARAW